MFGPSGHGKARKTIAKLLQVTGRSVGSHLCCTVVDERSDQGLIGFIDRQFQATTILALD
jgi:hypothetical protein